MTTIPLSDWNGAPVFGVRTPDDSWVIRPSAYGVVQDERGWIAIVRTPEGIFLPGGGQEPGESPEEAVCREVLEECGLAIRLGSWEIRAVQFIYSTQESFADCGAGVPLERRAQVFERFWKGDRNGKGAGLGLAIVKRIITAMQGSVSVSSSPHGGAAFTLHFSARSQ